MECDNQDFWEQVAKTFGDVFEIKTQMGDYLDAPTIRALALSTDVYTEELFLSWGPEYASDRIHRNVFHLR